MRLTKTDKFRMFRIKEAQRCKGATVQWGYVIKI